MLTDKSVKSVSEEYTQAELSRTFMKTILVLAQNPELPNAIRSALESHPYRIIHRPDIDEAEPLLKHGALDVCLLDADQPQVQAMWTIEKLRELGPELPVLVFTTTRSPEWEETAYLRGVSQILTKPVRGRLLHSFLERLSTPARNAPSARRLATTGPIPPSSATLRQEFPRWLESLQKVATLLPQAYSVPSLLQAVLPSLRRSLAVHRIVVFLRQPLALEAGSAVQAEGRRLHSIAALGVSSKVLEHFELSLDNGLGACLGGRVGTLRRNSEHLVGNTTAEQEMDVLGVESIVSLMEGEVMLGLIGFSEKINGEVLDRETVEALFFLGEHLAQAIRQIWANERVVRNHGMMADILRELNSACVVVGRDLRILHANKAAQTLFLAPADRQTELTYSDLPQTLCNRVYQVLKTGNAAATFKYRPSENPGRLFQVSIIPFQGKDMLLPVSALLMMEDQTQSEQLKRLEIEAANLRLVRTMADRLAHEIGNALVPVSTHQQLLATRHKDPEFRASLETALASSVKRIARLVNQMVLLAQDRPVAMQRLPIVLLIEEGFREAQRHLPIQTATLKQSNESTSATVFGDHDALKHALAEVFINALQANPAEAKVAIRTYEHTEEDGTRTLKIEIMDTGEGFLSETAGQATEAFFTTRSVGLGLGLTVTRKVIENHQGKLEIIPSEGNRGGFVVISLPLEGAP